jgi:alkanesulfonate monooxygenase SsuD/methylene tetrahydromethanopterin reductase-like flavin-dependent oxidoreductase (luciferase family)
MNDIEFGLFDWVDRGTGTTAELYESRLALIEAAEAAGFRGYHMAEHHGTPLGMAPSPSVFLAAVAQRTRTLRFGPLAFLLPLYDPLRLVEEVCMLDHLSGGRVELGISKGVSPHELACFGVEAGDTRRMFEESLSVFRAGMTQDTLNFEGEHYAYTGVPMEISPLQQPYPPLWYPTHNLESVDYAARHGYHFASLGPVALVRQLTDRYRAVWAAHRHAPDRINGHVESPKLAAMRQIFIADTDEEALRVGRAAYDDWYSSITRLWHRHDDHSVDQLFDWDLGIAAETVLIGSPQTVAEKAARLFRDGGINYLIGAFAWGSLTPEQCRHSLELFSRHVMPACRP